MYILLSIIIFPFLSCSNDNEGTKNTAPLSVNLSLLMNDVEYYSSVTGILEIYGDGLNGLTVEKGICYSASKSVPTIDDETTTVSGTANTGQFEVNVSDLKELTNYMARPYFKYNNDVYYGRVVAFKTIGSSLEFYPSTSIGSSEDYAGYTLVWSDEFNIDGLPGSDWSYENGFQRNQELQWYQRDNASVKDGCLVIEGRRETINNPNYVAGSNDWKTNRRTAEYTSSSLTTQGTQEFMYGRFEIRAKIPVAMGSWPAIWLLGNQWEWPMNGEIDVLEYYLKNGTPSILANACWSSNQQWTAVWNEKVIPLNHFTANDPDWIDKFHIWRMDWDRNNIRLYLDDELLNDIDLSQTYNQGYNNNYQNPFNTDTEGFAHYILLNLALGSNGGTPDNNAFPMKYKIDYVRVYQPES